MTTLHSPGQLVIYPIVRLRGGSLAAGAFARGLLAAAREWVRGNYGLEAALDREHPGLYVEGRKLASVGISVRGEITMHGVAINVNNDLELFRAIIPCGVPEARMTSVARELGGTAPVIDFGAHLAAWLKQSWGYAAVEV
jgi:lipoate-protein ligase B